MYLDKYEFFSNGTNVCEPYVAVDYRDRWAASHTLLPFVLVFVLRVRPAYAMLVVYAFESIEIGTALCLFNPRDFDEFEKIPDTILIDPFYGACGIAAAWWCLRAWGRPSADARSFEKGRFVAEVLWTLLVPSLSLWLVDDDDLAGGLFLAVLATTVASTVAWRRADKYQEIPAIGTPGPFRPRETRVPSRAAYKAAALYALTVGIGTVWIPYNPLYTVSVATTIVVVAGIFTARRT